MIVVFIRIVLIALFFFLIYSLFKYLFNPKRKLELAHEQKEFYLLDDKENVRKNFTLTYRGVLFEGEKYLGTTSQSFEVVSIFIWPKTENKLNGFSIFDFNYIQDRLKLEYPYAKIEWKSPVKEFLLKKQEQEQKNKS
ncbi:sigma-w pathway protein ysdB [Metabacillus fastidiosus]|uniref:Sigma-w pathway protein ysdB n=1 Tax=Metabacillus fastidiosus TaxID=1458 RepID=A0ABU6NVM7_9BACI|nr:sigma-w pathway protein ysdB [Metabacillus fastidiosus]MEC2077638.1 sigma-w pathway protein ysdB [Metabacillus fastidiosus]MED4401159.1 sigma-w pathway protein ysdB [Metabacillus fastidiosus]MED4464086.1 sigma-w pathway protein ysdB [Metabacillus fastidiosus]